MRYSAENKLKQTAKSQRILTADCGRYCAMDPKKFEKRPHASLVLPRDLKAEKRL